MVLRSSKVFVGAALGMFAAAAVYGVVEATRCLDECHRYAILLGLGTSVGLAGILVFLAVRSVRSRDGVPHGIRLAAWVLLAWSVLLVAWGLPGIIVRPEVAGPYVIALSASVMGLIAFALVRRLAQS